jgi:hypothetical protein
LFTPLQLAQVALAMVAVVHQAVVVQVAWLGVGLLQLLVALLEQVVQVRADTLAMET